MIKRVIASFKLAFLILKISLRGGDEMDVIYATLIIEGFKTFAEVPRVIKPRVKATLEALGFGGLAVEN